MSRIGRAPIQVPANVTVTVADGNTVTVEGTTSRWVEDLAPNTDRTDIVPLIRNRTVTVAD